MSIENRYSKIHSVVNPEAIIRIVPGHFATTHSHINYYVDMTIMKSRRSEAAAAASVLARKYSNSSYVDSIICMDGCEVIGAYLAEELTQSGVMSLNKHNTMYIVSPEIHTGGQLIFRDNMQMMIQGKHCVLLVASATTGRTIAKALECIRYYGGIVEGISAIFSASDKIAGMEINSIFGCEDLPEYKTYEPMSCPLCQEGKKLDAIVNSYGYSKL